MLVHEILEYSANRLPDKIALIEEEREFTYAHVMNCVEILAKNLAAKGIAKGDRVALLFPNCIEFCLSYFAALSLGAIVVPLNNRLTPKEFTYILNDSQPSILILDNQFWDTYESFKGSLSFQPKIICSCDSPREGIDCFGDFLETEEKNQFYETEINLDDPACIMYTSGTTGQPKGAVMSHRNILFNARNCGVHLRYRESDTTLVVVPLFHVTGLNTQLVAFFYVGGTVVIMRQYNTTKMIELLEKHNVTTMITVPTMYTLMLNNSGVESADLSSLHTLLYGGAPMDNKTIVSLQQKLGVELINAYGLTETSSVATAMPSCDTLRKGASVGVAASGVQLRVVDNMDNDLGVDQVGELWIKGPNIVLQYWNNPTATEENLAGGWLKTGDYARIDEEGFVYIVDRKKDMINRGGENIYSIEVEAVLLAYPKVLEAAVVPRPHSIFGEVVHAFIVPVPGENPTEEEIINHCQKHIADYKVPSSVSTLQELPRNPGGKVLKNTLRSMVPPGDPPRR